jgi:hypothetical protein
MVTSREIMSQRSILWKTRRCPIWQTRMTWRRGRSKDSNQITIRQTVAFRTQRATTRRLYHDSLATALPVTQRPSVSFRTPSRTTRQRTISSQARLER